MTKLVSDLMSDTLAVCTAETTIEQAAKLMVQHDCGEIPVVETMDDKRPIGVVTDRDIVCRLIAKGRNPLDATVQACMSQPVVTIMADDTIDDAVALMQRHQVRRLPVVDDTGACIGMVAQADIAWSDEGAAGELVREVSRDTGTESR